MLYKASEDPSVKRLEVFSNIFQPHSEEILVLLPDRMIAVRIPTDAEEDLYWYEGPSAFSSPERFEEVRAYMRHYFIDADSAPKYWEQTKRIQEAISRFLEENE